MKKLGTIAQFWGAQAASLQFAAACREHSREYFSIHQRYPPGKLPGGAGWQPALPRTESTLTNP
jgi:hypothetical protein